MAALQNGLAVQRDGAAGDSADGGKPVWMIDPRADKRLMAPDLRRGDEIALAPAIALQLAGSQRERLQEELAFLRRAQEAGKAGVRAGIGRCKAIQAFLKREARDGWRSFSQFRAREKAERFRGIEGLIDGRWTAKKKRDGDMRMLEQAAKFYLDASAPSASECIRAAEQWAVENGARVYKQSAVRKYLAKLPPAEVTFKRYGVEEFENKHAPYIERSYADLDHLEGMSDHHELDLICCFGEDVDPHTGEATRRCGRPWLTTIRDRYSGVVLAWILREADPDAGVIMECAHATCRDHGVLRSFYCDHGRDFSCRDILGESSVQRRKRLRDDPDSKAIHGFCAILNIAVIQSLPYNAKAKEIERFHRDISEQFCRQWPSFTGGSTSNKPERLAEVRAKHGEPAFEDVKAAMGEWFELYHNTISSGRGMKCTPNKAYAENLARHGKRVASPELLHLAFLRLIGPVKCGRNGVRALGMNWGQYETGHLQGQEVFVRVDDSDLSKVSVWSLENKFLCFAKQNRQIPAHADRALLKAAMKEQREYKRVLRNAQVARTRIHEDLPDTMFRLQQRRAARIVASRPPTPTPTSALVPARSPLEGELNRYQIALESTKPATAEERKQRAQSQKDFMAAIEDAYDRGQAERDAEAEKQREVTRNFWMDYGLKDDPEPSESPFRKPVVNVPSLTEIMEGAA